jgi:chorismate synthase
VTQRNETDAVSILSGVYEGKTTGTPIALIIQNEDQRSRDYGNLAEVFRPGHADYAYWHKYGVRDPRGGGRASARLTAPIVAAGAVAGKWLKEQYKTSILGCLSQMGGISIPFRSWDFVVNNPFFAATDDPALLAEMESFIEMLRREGDSTGARIDVIAQNVPVGLGNPLYDKLDAKIAAAMMGINAVKGVEIGAGFRCVSERGSEHSDELTPSGFTANRSGGVLGGISTGQDVVVSIAIKPTPSISIERNSIDIYGNPVMVGTQGRHDPCVGIRAVPVAEAMLKLVLIDAALMHRAQCADVVVFTPDIAALK